MFDEWISTVIFVDISTMSFYFPDKIIEINGINEEQISVKDWIQLVVDRDVNVLNTRFSKITLNCSLNKPEDSCFDNFPVHFPNSIWSNGILSDFLI